MAGGNLSMALRRTVNRQTRDDKFVVNKSKQAIFTPTQKLLLSVWRLAVKSWSASVINPVELDPKGAITVVFSQYNKPKKNKKKTSIINRRYYSPSVGESTASL